MKQLQGYFYPHWKIYYNDIYNDWGTAEIWNLDLGGKPW